MKNELSYLTPEGFTVFTGHFHKNRGTCCKSACLHCPYGFTIKKHGIQFIPVSNREDLVADILSENHESQFEWRNYLPDNILFLSVKGSIAGVLFKNHIVIKKMILRPHFQQQNLSKELVESYLFI
jgi:hypothetical protein